jgi:hypothetical protein
MEPVKSQNAEVRPKAMDQMISLTPISFEEVDLSNGNLDPNGQYFILDGKVVRLKTQQVSITSPVS